MKEIPGDGVVVAVIGDVVGSRHAADRRRLHDRLEAVLADANRAWRPMTPFRVTVGDEYQGVFEHLGDAVRATLRLRLALLPEYDVRHGIGRGAVTVLGEEPRVEDGPGWWAAREALEAVERAERSPRHRWRRTAFRPAEPTVTDGVAASPGENPVMELSTMVEATLMLRDQMVGDLGDRSVSVLRGLLGGRTQHEIAGDLGISPSAVSQRIRSGGLAALVAADERIGDA